MLSIREKNHFTFIMHCVIYLNQNYIHFSRTPGSRQPSPAEEHLPRQNNLLDQSVNVNNSFQHQHFQHMLNAEHQQQMNNLNSMNSMNNMGNINNMNNMNSYHPHHQMSHQMQNHVMNGGLSVPQVKFLNQGLSSALAG